MTNKKEKIAENRIYPHELLNKDNKRLVPHERLIKIREKTDQRNSKLDMRK